MAQEQRVDQAQSVWEVQWRERIEAWRRSGQTQQAFCRAHGLAAGSFSHWKTELVRRDDLRASAGAATATAAGGDGADGRGRESSQGALGWSEVRWPAAGPDVVRDGAGLEIVLPGGWSVRLGPRFEAE